MKKLLVMVTMLILIVSLVACGESLDLGDHPNNHLNAFDLLRHSNEAQANITSMITEINVQTRTSRSGELIDDYSTMMRMEIENENKLRVDFNHDITGSTPFSSTVFLRKGYLYTEMDRSDSFDTPLRFREEMDPFFMMEINSMVNFFDMNFITEEMLADSSVTLTDNGYRVAFTLDIEGVLALANHLGTLDDPDEDFETFYFSVLIYLDENYLPIFSQIIGEVSFDGELDEITMTMTTIQIGNVVINFPDWLDELKYGSVNEPTCDSDNVEHHHIEQYNEFFEAYLQEIGHDNHGFVGLPESWIAEVIGDEDHILILGNGWHSITMSLIDSGPASNFTNIYYDMIIEQAELVGRIETVCMGSYEVYRLMGFYEENDQYRLVFIFDRTDGQVQIIEIRDRAEVVAELEHLIISTFRR